MAMNDSDAILMATKLRGDRQAANRGIQDTFRLTINALVAQRTQSTANIVACKTVLDAAVTGQTQLSAAEVARLQAEDAAALAFFNLATTATFISTILTAVGMSSADATATITAIRASAAAKTANV